MQEARSSAASRRRRNRLLALCSLAFSFAATNFPLEASVGVKLAADPAGPAMVGTMITLSPELSGLASTDLWYRFRVREAGGDFRTIRDYGPERNLQWTSLDEGRYEMELSVRERTTGELLTALTTIDLTSRVSGESAVVSPTANPLVYLFSAPCEPGRARVRFAKEGFAPRYTTWKECSAAGSVNFYLAGLTAETPYFAALESSADTESPDVMVPFTTGRVSWERALPRPIVSAPSGREGVLLQASLFLPAFATDMDGNLLWFAPSDLSYLTHSAPGGTFWGLANSHTHPSLDRVRLFDLVGMTVRETNAARVNEQLLALGHHPITGFHHEARTIPGDRVVVLASEERLLTNVQGSGTVDVLGDVILVLDSNMQVVWVWDSFDHLDTSRVAILGESCAEVAGCAAHYLSADAKDWTHGNSVARTSDGNFIFSIRHQDWVVKIDYSDGAGSGRVIWRLGAEGDFRIVSDDPHPWFSHQHDAQPINDGSSTIVLFDNGNTRVARGLGETSRGQVFELDEENMVAYLRLNADLQVSSPALGSAQKLEGGDYHFDAGLVPNQGSPGFRAFSLQVDPSGNILSSLSLAFPVYRSYRLESLYGPEAPARRRPIGRE